jgi:hypothetical protein
MNSVETDVSLKKQKLKNEIDMKVDQCKEELEEARNRLHQDVDRYFDAYKS